MSNVTQTSGKLTESRANFMKNCIERVMNHEYVCLNFAQYKYHFPFPTHELKTANLRERKYANLSLDYSNEKKRILILNNTSPSLFYSPFVLLFFHLLEMMSHLFVSKTNLSIIVISNYLLQGLYQSTTLKAELKNNPSFEYPRFFSESNRYAHSFFSHVFRFVDIFFRYVTIKGIQLWSRSFPA